MKQKCFKYVGRLYVSHLRKQNLCRLNATITMEVQFKSTNTLT
jgi:hypothetical protein